MSPGEARPEASAAPAQRGPWYRVGWVLQCLLWTLVWSGFVVAWASGMEVTDFRYVGF